MYNKPMMESSGHINPILHHIFCWHVSNTRLKIEKRSFNRYGISKDDYRQLSWKAKLFNSILFLLSPIIPGHDGHISIYKLSKPELQQSQRA